MWSQGGVVSFGALGGCGAAGAGVAGGMGEAGGARAGFVGSVGPLGGAGLAGCAGLAGAGVGGCCRITEISCDTVSLAASLAVTVIWFPPMLSGTAGMFQLAEP